ncbi:MAG: barstar family protein [Pyrinomonadaceae bacterium]
MKDDIWEPSSKCNFYLVDATPSAITNWALQISNRNPSTEISFVRGDKMKTTQGLFDEFSAAMQFPYYFGENWDAFRDCLLDLEWLPGEAHGVIVTNSHSLLEESSKDLGILFDDLEEAGSEFKQQGKRFVTLFQYEGEKKTEVYKTLESVGLFFQEIEIK